MNAGKQNIQPKAEVKPEQVYTFSYTSGTTGNPKGALITHRNFVSAIANQGFSTLKFNTDDVYLSYLPLPHVMERLALSMITYIGACMGFY